MEVTSPTIYYWKKTFFSNSYKVFKKEEKVGLLSQKWFSQDARAKIGLEELSFKSYSIFSSEINIIDKNNIHIGRIKYNIWKTEADIQLNGDNYYCKMDGFFSFNVVVRKSKINPTGLIIVKGNSQKGEVQDYHNNSKLILCGIYLMNYYIEFWVSLILIGFLLYI